MHPPLDPDSGPSGTPPGGRPLHLRAWAVALVFIGGALGTAAREGVALAVAPIERIPVAIGLVNLVGAFVLGVLLESLARRGPDKGRRRELRLLAGTGFCGGFTTYSALATDTALLLGDGDVLRGLGYSLLTVVLGALATWAGLAVAARTHRAAAT
ncbi:fluoride efflux transporter FluC [Epidermidibacterium keratini]|uniref:fluoride efflux transporter FluC n=1 Tax=Epidermidibacterium keratini TaxID=1891644 RepID=UPI001CEFA1C8|nr:CrcB family protein [Epidermidibacterium keratini]